MLSVRERSELLARARRAARAALGLSTNEPHPSDPSKALLSPGMSFVTWKRDGQLRGCIGSVEPVRPLWADVEANAVHALLEDPRFPPATPDEFPHLRLEISVLTPFVPVSDPLREVKVGVHGLLVERGPHRGLLLPQVPLEWGWDVPAFLGHSCRKAGLPADAWRDSRTAISTFTADVFGEEDGAAGG
ncbi:MAG: AmmeMemoRadiSam system protein A [Acidobacteria bacterium]|nr:AmmeMemoRadiSam system protein A [Acidobacteriota bacterium]